MTLCFYLTSCIYKFQEVFLTVMLQTRSKCWKKKKAAFIDLNALLRKFLEGFISWNRVGVWFQRPENSNSTCSKSALRKIVLTVFNGRIVRIHKLPFHELDRDWGLTWKWKKGEICLITKKQVEIFFASIGHKRAISSAEAILTNWTKAHNDDLPRFCRRHCKLRTTYFLWVATFQNSRKKTK